MDHGTVDEGVASAAPLICGASCIPYAGNDEAVLYPPDTGLVRGEPGYCTYRTRREEDAIAQARAPPGEFTCQYGQQRET
jgi:hypothetical protein